VYLINTSDGDVLINTGFMDNAERNKKLLAPVRKGGAAQDHPDASGTPTTMVACRKLAASWRPRSSRKWRFKGHVEFLSTNWGPFLGRRSGKALGLDHEARQGAPAGPPPHVVADIEVDREYSFEQGGRKFVCYSTPRW